MLTGVWHSKAGVIDRAPFKTIFHLITVKNNPCKFYSNFYSGENP